MTGMTPSKCVPPRAPSRPDIDLTGSVRAKIRDGIDDHNAFDDYLLRCLYEGENGNPAEVEKGFLKSNLLVKVQIPLPLSPPFHENLTTHPADFPDDIYCTLVCTGEP